MDGYSARATLSLGVELRRQLKRRRTLVAYILAMLLPVTIMLSVKYGSSRQNGGGGFADGDFDIFGLMASGPWNFALSGLFITATFLLVIIAAMFSGDTVASEASWSTMRYLLVAPVPRRRFLMIKLTVSLMLMLSVVLTLIATSFLLGWVAFGSGTLASPLGGTLSASESTWRLAIIAGYICVTLLVPAGVAFLAGVLTDVPLGAVGSAVVIVVVVGIMNAVTALGDLRKYLPSHYNQSWADALGPEILWDQMAIGFAYDVSLFIVLVAIAVYKFDRKDILS